MSQYVAYVGRVRLVSEDAEKLRSVLKRERDRKVRAAQKDRQRAIRREVREFCDRYQDCVFRYGNAEGLLCTFRPREQQIIARWWVDQEFTPPKNVAFMS